MIYGETKGVMAYAAVRVEDAFTTELTNSILRLLDIGHREQHITGPLLEKHLARELHWTEFGLLDQYKKYVEDRLLADLQVTVFGDIPEKDGGGYMGINKEALFERICKSVNIPKDIPTKK